MVLKEKSDEFYSYLSSAFPFWGSLSEEEKDTLFKNSASVLYRAGENIHGGSGECTGSIIVKSGVVRAYLLSEDGREVTLYRLYPGDICMLSASCVLQSITFDVFVDAQADSECYIVNGKTFAALAESNSDMKIFALETAVSRFSEVIWVIQQILFMSFDKRLAAFLIDESAKTGSSVIKLTHEQIAKYMGSAREVVSRMMKYFAFEGMVVSRRGEVEITDKAKMRAMLG